MSLKNIYPTTIILKLKKYKSTQPGQIQYYVAGITKESKIKTFFVNILEKIGLVKKPLIPSVSSSLNMVHTSLHIKASQSLYSLLTDGSYTYIENAPHLAVDKLVVESDIPGGLNV